MADSSESGTCEVPDCRLTEYQTVHKSHTSAHESESESESESETESRLPDQGSQLQVHVPTPETQNPRPLDCQFEGCEYSTPVGANMNQIIQFMKIHTRQVHPQTKQAQPGPSSLLLGSAFFRPILALTILIALLAVLFSIQETRDSRIATEAWKKAMEVEAKEEREAKERTDKEARDAKERADKEARDAKERADKEARDAKERADKETQDAKEKEAQLQKDIEIRDIMKADFGNFRNQDTGTHSSITVKELQFLDMKELHRCKSYEDVDAKQYDSTVKNLAKVMQFDDDQKEEFLLAKYSKSIVNVVEDFKYTADSGIYTYGKYQTLRRANGNLDITFAMHAFKWDINQNQMDTKGNSDTSDKPDRDVTKLKSGAQLKESERKAWKNDFRAEVIGLFQKDCSPHLLSDIGLQEKERKEKEKYEHEKVVKDRDDKQQEVNNLEKENENLKKKLDDKWF